MEMAIDLSMCTDAGFFQVKDFFESHYTDLVCTRKASEHLLRMSHGHWKKHVRQGANTATKPGKILAHALRMALQAKELANTGRIQYPLSYSERLKTIKLGEADDTVQQIDDEIKALECEVAFLELVSSLP